MSEAHTIQSILENQNKLYEYILILEKRIQTIEKEINNNLFSNTSVEEIVYNRKLFKMIKDSKDIRYFMEDESLSDSKVQNYMSHVVNLTDDLEDEHILMILNGVRSYMQILPTALYGYRIENIKDMLKTYSEMNK